MRKQPVHAHDRSGLGVGVFGFSVLFVDCIVLSNHQRTDNLATLGDLESKREIFADVIDGECYDSCGKKSAENPKACFRQAYSAIRRAIHESRIPQDQGAARLDQRMPMLNMLPLNP